MLKRRLYWYALIVFVLAGAAGVYKYSSAPQDHKSDQSNPAQSSYLARTYVAADQVRMPYRLYVPPTYDASKSYPLVVWLHGSDAIGNDNLQQLTGYNTPGTLVWTLPENQAKFPAIVIAPQSYERYWSMPSLKKPIREEEVVFEMVTSVQNQYNVDPGRVYLVGQSMGGYGTWAYLGRHQGFFAAGVILCGLATPNLVPQIASTPVWVFHGAKDDTVAVDDARRMVELLRKAGAQPRYTEYADIGHEVGPAVFAEKELLPWLFSQRRSKAIRNQP
jgi:predicted peptidase